MKRVLPLVLVTGASVWLAAFDFKASVSLRPDLSCSAEIDTTADLTALAGVFADIEARLGRPRKSAAEIHQAALDLAAKLAATRKEDEASWRGKLAQGLPAGIRLTAAASDLQGTLAGEKVQLACDDARKLWLVEVPGGRNPFAPPSTPPAQAGPRAGAASPSSPAATLPALPGAPGGLAAAGSGVDNGQQDPRREAFRDLSDRPFYGLEVIDYPDSVMVVLTFANPVPLMRALIGDQPTVPGLAVAEQLYAGRYIFSLDSPFEVISTNATRRDGRKLTWEIPIAAPTAKLEEILVARLKK